MSHYSEYVKERTGDSVIELLCGFACYRYLNDGKTVYITDIYISPEFRQDGWASKLADTVVAEAKAKGAVELIGSVVPSTNHSTRSLQVLIGYGMTLSSAQNNFIVFRKDI